MLILALLGSLLSSLVSLAAALSSTGSSVLVILESALKRDDFSLFFNGLEERGYELTFRAPKEDEPPMFVHDDPQFAHVILFAPTTKGYAKDITPQSLVSLLGSSSNILIALSTAPTPLTSLAAEFGLILPPPHTPLISHFPSRPLPHTTIPIPLPASPLLTPGNNPILFKGVPHLIGTNPFIVPILKAPPESFAADADADSGADALVDAAEKGGEGLWAGGAMGVVTGFQARGGARATFVGGVDVFSDAFAKAEVEKGIKSGNKVFVQDVAKWTFQETSVLRIDNTTHFRKGESEPRKFYTTNDQIGQVYQIQISEYNPTKGTWLPASNIKDLQLEFTMLDPHIRIALRPVTGKAGQYEAAFRAPDRHGVFKFVVEYKRKGITHLLSSMIVSLVPPRHDGYPRFLSAAWPYYAGAVSTSVGFVVFSTLWLGGEGAKKGKGKME